MWICSSSLYIVPEKAVALAAESSHYVFVLSEVWLLIKQSRTLYRLSWIAALYICIPSGKWTQSGHSCILPRCLLVSDALGDCREDFLLCLYTLAFIRMVFTDISSILLKCRWNWIQSWGRKPGLWRRLGLVPPSSRVFENVPGTCLWCWDVGIEMSARTRYCP